MSKGTKPNGSYSLSKSDVQLLFLAEQRLGGATGRKVKQLGTRIFEKLCAKDEVVDAIFQEAANIRCKPRHLPHKHELLVEHGRYFSEILDMLFTRLKAGQSANGAAVVAARHKVAEAAAAQKTTSVLGILSAVTEKETKTKIEDYGYCHAQFDVCHTNMTRKVWDEFGSVAAETLAAHQVNRSQRLTQRAWTILAAVLTDELQAGYHMGVMARRQNAGEKFMSVVGAVASLTGLKALRLQSTSVSNSTDSVDTPGSSQDSPHKSTSNLWRQAAGAAANTQAASLNERLRPRCYSSVSHQHSKYGTPRLLTIPSGNGHMSSTSMPPSPMHCYQKNPKAFLVKKRRNYRNNLASSTTHLNSSTGDCTEFRRWSSTEHQASWPKLQDNDWTVSGSTAGLVCDYGTQQASNNSDW